MAAAQPLRTDSVPTEAEYAAITSRVFGGVDAVEALRDRLTRLVAAVADGTVKVDVGMADIGRLWRFLDALALDLESLSNLHGDLEKMLHEFSAIEFERRTAAAA